MNRSLIDVPVATPYWISPILGGMITPNSAEDATVAPAKSLSYLCFNISGIMIVPTAAAVAALDPDIAAKNAQVMIATMASPPEMCPNRLLHKFTNLFEIPPELIRFPASTKNGIASNVKLPLPENIRCITIAL